MDNSLKKWLVRGGSFLILFGFFIPSMAVSCSVYGVTQKQSFSMSTAATQFDLGILYLVVVGVLATLVFSFLMPRSNQQRLMFIFGEGGGLILGVFGILIAVIGFSSKIQELGLSFSVEAGFFVLFFGYAMAGFGIVLEFFQPERGSNYPTSYVASPQPDFAPTNYEPPAPRSPVYSQGARLELIKGPAPREVVISQSDFSIGRSRQNHCSINDPRVSGMHARIRSAQGSWFIQDQNSTGGTFVNGNRIQAQRLNDGDQISIGDTTFRFRM